MWLGRLSSMCRKELSRALGREVGHDLLEAAAVADVVVESRLARLRLRRANGRDLAVVIEVRQPQDVWPGAGAEGCDELVDGDAAQLVERRDAAARQALGG